MTQYCYVWHGWLVQKALASHQGDPIWFPAGAICELSCALVFCCATRVFQIIWFFSFGKSQTLSILPVLRGHNGLMWLAAKCALACLLLKHVVAASFSIQLLLYFDTLVQQSSYIPLSGLCHWFVLFMPKSLSVIGKSIILTTMLQFFHKCWLWLCNALWFKEFLIFSKVWVFVTFCFCVLVSDICSKGWDHTDSFQSQHSLKS